MASLGSGSAALRLSSWLAKVNNTAGSGYEEVPHKSQLMCVNLQLQSGWRGIWGSEMNK